VNRIDTNINGCFVVEPRVFEDERGYFFESFRQDQFDEYIGKVNFIQDNESKSTYGVLRGLHYQLPPFAQSKLVRVIKGKVLDVAVDIRKKSPTFGKHVSVELSEENKRQLFIPRGFAHGFVSLSDEVIFSYKCDNYYNKENEASIIYNDKALNIDWKINVEDILLSEKDKRLPDFKNAIYFNS
jgi:dTDP-4-dehydrorhamnose 3,5-epimerase